MSDEEIVERYDKCIKKAMDLLHVTQSGSEPVAIMAVGLYNAGYGLPP